MNKLLLEFPVLWAGWEGDYEGEVRVDPYGECYLSTLPNHARYRKEAGIQLLIERIKEYEQALLDARAALELLTADTKKGL